MAQSKLVTDISSSYKEKIWGKDEGGEQVTDGYVFRGKRTFKIAREGLETTFKKGKNIEKNGVKLRILDTRIKGVELEIEVQVIHRNEKGVALIKLYGPNKRKENVVSVTRSKGSEPKFVNILAENVVKPMINDLLQGENELGTDSKLHKCPHCEKTSNSLGGIKSHITKMHKLQKLRKDEDEKSIAIEAQKVVENIIDSIIQISDTEEETENTKDITLEEIADGDFEMKYQKKCDSCDYEVKAERKYLIVRQMLNHKNHVHKNNSAKNKCDECDITFDGITNMKRHMRDVHNCSTFSTSPPPKKCRGSVKVVNETEEEAMETESSEEEIIKSRSKRQDEKVEAKNRKNMEEDQFFQKKKEEMEKQKIIQSEAAKVEEKRQKQKIKNQRKKSGKNKDNDSNIKEVPTNIKHLVNKGDVVYVVPGDGLCGPNAGAAKLFQDEKFGPDLKRKANLFFAEHFYKKYQYKTQCSVESPYKRNIKGGEVVFTDPDELIKFLKYHPNANLMWTDSEDLAVISDMFQIKIKIITTKGHTDENPTVNWIYPDPSMKEFAELTVDMEDLILLHEDDTHFNLIISEDSDLVKCGNLSKRLDCSAINEGSENNIDENNEEFLIVKSELKKCKIELEKCNLELYKKTEEVEKLKLEVKDLREIVKLRDELSQKNDSIMEVDEVDDAATLVSLKRSGFKRKNPQTESIRNCKDKNDSGKRYPCEKCNFTALHESLLKIHIQSIHTDEIMYSCDKCEHKEASVGMIQRHKQMKHTNMDKSEEKSAQQTCTECGYKALSEFLLRRHVQSRHIEERNTSCYLEEEYNCLECPFQGTSEEQLKKHFVLKHVITCRICNKQFKEKRELMLHRKSDHPNLVRPCKNYSNGACNFNSESCYWSHESKENETSAFNCFICRKAFQNKVEVMKHRKTDHISHVEPCNKFLTGECPFQSKFCWFLHTINSIEKENILVFPEATKEAKPPIKPYQNKA